MSKFIAESVAIATFALASPALAHDAPTGWSYDPACCQNIDCRPIASSTVKEGPNGYLIKIYDETVPYNDARIKDSPDGMFHRCTPGGRDDVRTICLYVPPRRY